MCIENHLEIISGKIFSASHVWFPEGKREYDRQEKGYILNFFGESLSRLYHQLVLLHAFRDQKLDTSNVTG
jgi:hypothetical protein